MCQPLLAAAASLARQSVGRLVPPFGAPPAGPLPCQAGSPIMLDGNWVRYPAGAAPPDGLSIPPSGLSPGEGPAGAKPVPPPPLAAAAAAGFPPPPISK